MMATEMVEALAAATITLLAYKNISSGGEKKKIGKRRKRLIKSPLNGVAAKCFEIKKYIFCCRLSV